MFRLRARHGTTFVADAKQLSEASAIRIRNSKGKIDIDPDDLMELLNTLRKQEIRQTYQQMSKEQLLELLILKENL